MTNFTRRVLVALAAVLSISSVLPAQGRGVRVGMPAKQAAELML